MASLIILVVINQELRISLIRGLMLKRVIKNFDAQSLKNQTWIFITNIGIYSLKGDNNLIHGPKKVE